MEVPEVACVGTDACSAVVSLHARYCSAKDFRQNCCACNVHMGAVLTDNARRGGGCLGEGAGLEEGC